MAGIEVQALPKFLGPLPGRLEPLPAWTSWLQWRPSTACSQCRSQPTPEYCRTGGRAQLTGCTRTGLQWSGPQPPGRPIEHAGSAIQCLQPSTADR